MRAIPRSKPSQVANVASQRPRCPPQALVDASPHTAEWRYQIDLRGQLIRLVSATAIDLALATPAAPMLLTFEGRRRFDCGAK
jgi:hypothetical protein